MQHVHYKALDPVNISKVFKKLFISNFCLFLFLLADDVTLLAKLVTDFNCK